MKRRRTAELFVWACCLGVLGLAAAIDFTPGGSLAMAGADLDQVCLMRRWTGVGCPFCGMSRSVVAFVHGRPAAAVTYHPLGPVVVLGFVAFTVAAAVAAWRRSAPAIESKAFPVFGLTLIAASVVVWAVRLAAGTLP